MYLGLICAEIHILPYNICQKKRMIIFPQKTSRPLNVFPRVLESESNAECNPLLRNSSCMADVVTHLSIHLSVTAVIGMDLEWLFNI